VARRATATPIRGDYYWRGSELVAPKGTLCDVISTLKRANGNTYVDYWDALVVRFPDGKEANAKRGAIRRAR
jgi:hypothetical protein